MLKFFKRLIRGLPPSPEAVAERNRRILLDQLQQRCEQEEVIRKRIAILEDKLLIMEMQSLEEDAADGRGADARHDHATRVVVCQADLEVQVGSIDSSNFAAISDAHACTPN